MQNITEEEVRHVAKLARLRLSEEEIKKFSKDMSAIVTYVGILNELDTDKIKPTEQVVGLRNVYREDEVMPYGKTTNRVLSCSPLPIVNRLIETLSAHETD